MTPNTRPYTGVMMERNHPEIYSFDSAAKAIFSNNVPCALTLPNLGIPLVENVLAGFIDFQNSNAPRERLRWGLHIDRTPEPNELDDGYMRRTETDKKNVFHYRSDFESNLWKLRGLRPTEGEKRWLDVCEQLLQLCTSAFLRLAEELDRVHPRFHFLKRAREATQLNVLRILHYDAGYETLAHRHTDRCAITFALSESSKGLEIFKGFSSEICKSPCAPNVFVFPGQTLERITAGEVRALWHGARANGKSTEPRYVIVFFGKMTTT